MTKKNVKILIKELNTSGIDVNISGMNMRRHRLGSRSKKKDQIDRLEDDLDKTLTTLERLEEYVRHLHRMMSQMIKKNRKGNK